MWKILDTKNYKVKYLDTLVTTTKKISDEQYMAALICVHQTIADMKEIAYPDTRRVTERFIHHTRLFPLYNYNFDRITITLARYIISGKMEDYQKILTEIVSLVTFKYDPNDTTGEGWEV
jgi:hypothetical protein